MALARAKSSLPDVFGEISEKGDCPAMVQAIQELHQLRKQDNFPAQALARVILKDPGLSSKVLRVVNSAFFRTRGEPITTISKAVVLMGIDAVVDLASGIVMVEQFDQADPALHQGLIDSLRSALLAQALADRVSLPSPEEAYLLGLFSNLGRLWLAAHYREELARAVELEAREATCVEDAVERHFGFSPNRLAAEILQNWGFPQKYVQFFLRKTAGRLAADEKLLLVADLAKERDDAVLIELAQDRLGLSEERARQTVAAALSSLTDQADAMGIGGIAPSGPPKKPASAKSPARPASKPASKPGLKPVRAAARTASKPGAAAAEEAAEWRKADPAFGLEAAGNLARAIVDRRDLGSLLGEVLESVARAGGFDGALLYLADHTQGNLVPKLGFPVELTQAAARLAVPLTAESGCAALTAVKNEARVVEEASAASLVPAGVEAPALTVRSLVAHPLCVRSRVIGVLLAFRKGAPAVNASSVPVVQLFSQLAALAIDDCAPPSND